MALGVLADLRDRGVAVPEGCSVVGSDGAPAAMASPGLATITTAYVAELAECAVALLLERLASTSSPANSVVIRPHLVVGDTTALARRPAGAVPSAS